MLRWRLQILRKWLTPGLGIKRWLLLLMLGMVIGSIALAQLLVDLYRDEQFPEVFYILTLRFLPMPVRVFLGLTLAAIIVTVAILQLNRSIIAPFVRHKRGKYIDVKYRHTFGEQGLKVVAIGGGTGLPSVLRGLKRSTSNITAIVTVADDGGSSGRLRRELGVLPPGDLRNNLAALADDESLLTQLFQYRFGVGGLEGHSFGNLFITALASITGSMDRALVEAGSVLAIQGRVLPSTMQDVMLCAEVRTPDGMLKHVVGESDIPKIGGIIERVYITPETTLAYPDSIRAILSAELIVIGPGSLYTSILPNLLIGKIPEALRASSALRLYVCNVATQQGETDNFTVADHIMAIERNAGRNLFDVVLANNTYPDPKGTPTHYVMPAPADHEVRQRYDIIETDLTDPKYPWRHSHEKLSITILGLIAQRQMAFLNPQSERSVNASSIEAR